MTKHHKMSGYDVEVIASCQTYDKNGDYAYNLEPGSYINENGIPVTRIPYKKENSLCYKLRYFVGLSEALEKSSPDIIFIHNCQFMDMGIVTKYLDNHKDVKVFVDNHADFSNSGTNKISYLIHRTIWRRCAKKIEPYTTKFYGVLPVRVDFLRNVYNLPEEKCELLVMGADDEQVENALNPSVKAEIRRKYGIEDDDFLVITGGKIDAFKTQTLLLMDAVNSIDKPKLKLIVFGSVTQELKNEVEKRCSDRVQYIGWQKSDYSYPLFASADLACFPGRHSVFWEQVTGQGIPMIVKKWNGTTHIDLGGNVRFLTQDSMDEIKSQIEDLMNNPEKYNEMKRIAVENGMKVFSYKDIAKRSIGV